MSEYIDLNYEPDSLVPSTTLKKIRTFEDAMTFNFDCKIKLPKEFVYQLLNYHGGIPGKQCFKESENRFRIICRFCNILKVDEYPLPIIPSWRFGSEEDARYEYSIYYLTDCDPYCIRLDSDPYGDRPDEEGVILIPIAALDTAGGLNARGMTEMDLLCLNYQDKSREEPTVVTWSFESSWANPDETKLVANTFSEFLTMLHEIPSDYPPKLLKALEVDDDLF